MVQTPQSCYVFQLHLPLCHCVLTNIKHLNRIKRLSCSIELISKLYSGVCVACICTPQEAALHHRSGSSDREGIRGGGSRIGVLIKSPAWSIAAGIIVDILQLES